MTNSRLIIQLIDEEIPKFRCFHATFANPIEASVDGLLAIVNRSEADKVVAYVSGANVISTQLELPTHQRQRIIQAVPYMLEDELIGEIEETHFAVSRKQIEGGYGVMVVSHRLMQHWSDLFKHTGVKVDAIYPDYLGLPLLNGDRLLYQSGEQILLRENRYTGHSLSSQLLPHSVADITKYKKIMIGDVEAESNEEVISYTTESAMWLEGVKNLPDFDLLQGEYNKSEQIGKRMLVWRSAAALLVLWLGILFAADVIEYNALSKQDQQIQTQIVAIYKQAFPNARKIVNPRLQMEQQLNTLRSPQSGDGFDQLITSAAPILGSNKDISLDGLRYKRQRLEVECQLKSLSDLDKLKEQFGKSGLKMSVQSANSKGGAVEARFTVEMKV